MTTHTAISCTGITITLSHWYDMYLYLRYMNTLVHWHFGSCKHLLHWTLLLHVLIPSITRIHYIYLLYIYITVTWVLYTVMAYICHIDLFVYKLDCSCIPIAWIAIRVMWLNDTCKLPYFCYMTITCLFLVTLILLWYLCYWTCELLICDVWS